MEKRESIMTKAGGKSEYLRYGFEKIIYNPVEKSYILYYKMYSGKFYSRRIISYDIGYYMKTIEIGEELKSIKDKSKGDAIIHLENNWSDYIQLSYNGLYSEHIILKNTSVFHSIGEYESEEGAKKLLKTICIDGDYVAIYDGYNGNFREFINM